MLTLIDINVERGKPSSSRHTARAMKSLTLTSQDPKIEIALGLIVSPNSNAGNNQLVEVIMTYRAIDVHEFAHDAGTCPHKCAIALNTSKYPIATYHVPDGDVLLDALEVGQQYLCLRDAFRGGVIPRTPMSPRGRPDCLT